MYILSLKTLEIIVYFTLIDILFLPYFHYFIIPYSLPIVFITLLLFGKIRNDIYFQLFVLISIFVLLSVLFSIVLFNLPTQYIIENLKRGFQFISTFTYFFFFKWVYKYYNMEHINRYILKAFIFIVGIMALIFILEPSYLVLLREIIYKSTAHRVEDIFEHRRFTYTFTDPNTAAYFYLIATISYISFYKENIYEIVAMLFFTGITVVATQSVGAAVAVFATMILYVVRGINFKKIEKKRIFKIISYIIIMIILFSIIIEYVTNIEVALERYKSRAQSDAVYSRKYIYARVISNITIYPFGRGYTLFIDQSPIRPHSDHIRIFYSYGLICYILVIYLFFKNIFNVKFLFIIPAFIAFSINSLIDEQKLFALFLIILAIRQCQQKTEKRM